MQSGCRQEGSQFLPANEEGACSQLPLLKSETVEEYHVPDSTNRSELSGVVLGCHAWDMANDRLAEESCAA